MVGTHASRSGLGSLLDRGANGGMCGNDATVIHEYLCTVDITGVNNQELNSLKIVDCHAKIKTRLGPVIAIFKQYAYHGKLRSINWLVGWLVVFPPVKGLLV
jgi:hypothetical protein